MYFFIVTTLSFVVLGTNTKPTVVISMESCCRIRQCSEKGASSSVSIHTGVWGKTSNLLAWVITSPNYNQQPPAPLLVLHQQKKHKKIISGKTWKLSSCCRCRMWRFIKLWLIWPYGFQNKMCSALNMWDCSSLCYSCVIVLPNTEILITCLL